MSGEKKSGMGDTLVKAVLVLFISLLSFSVGTFVGKQVSDSDHRKLALEGDYKPERGVASADEHGAAEGANEKISEKEVESLTEEFVNKEKAATEGEHEVAAEHGEENHAEKVAAAPAHETPKAEKEKDAAGFSTYARNAKAGEPALKGEAPKVAAHEPALKPGKHEDKQEPKKNNDGLSNIAHKVALDEAPTDGMKEERKPAAVLPSVASSAIGKYTVQVASYADEKEAKGHAAGLKGKGWNAFYLPATINGRTWYRVLVGLFDNSKSAQDFRAQFMKEANTKAAIVQKIVQ